MPILDARDLVHAWMNAVNSRQIADVLSLYADDAVLLPTFSPNTIRTEEARRGYFEQLATRPGLFVSLHEKTLRVQPIGDNVEIASGIYRFHLEVDGQPLVFEARFSFVISLSLTKPVLHHHSSQIPRTLS